MIKVINKKTGSIIECHPDGKGAARASSILNAHEIKNGRTSCYITDS